VSTNDLDDEYSPKAAAKARARAAQQRRIEHQREYLDAAPIADDAELSAAVRKLAGAWGLKRKKGRK
jgi:hypothetical protein